MNEPELITLTTKDNISLKAHYYKGTSTKALILAHQFTNSKESWMPLTEALPEDYHILALDLRGHGQSDLKWEEFHEQEFNDMIHDFIAAHDYLQQQGAQEIGIIGASIGANLALKYAAQYNVQIIVLLSPGLNYRGIAITEEPKEITIPTLILVGTEDEYSYNSSLQLMEQLQEQKKIITYKTKHHGTTLLKTPTIIQEICTWLNKNL